MHQLTARMDRHSSDSLGGWARAPHEANRLWARKGLLQPCPSRARITIMGSALDVHEFDRRAWQNNGLQSDDGFFLLCFRPLGRGRRASGCPRRLHTPSATPAPADGSVRPPARPGHWSRELPHGARAVSPGGPATACAVARRALGAPRRCERCCWRRVAGATCRTGWA